MLERFLFWRRNPDPGMELPQPNPDPDYVDGPAHEPRVVEGEAHLTASFEEIAERVRELREKGRES